MLMRRIILMLTAAAFMVAIMALTATPGFAQQERSRWTPVPDDWCWGVDGVPPGIDPSRVFYDWTTGGCYLDNSWWWEGR